MKTSTKIKIFAAALALLTAPHAAARVVPPVTPGHHPTYIGQYREGNALVPQIYVEPDRYLGFVYPQTFRPYYREIMVPLTQLATQLVCCVLSPLTHVNGQVRVIEVYLDPAPAGTEVRFGLIGPIESWVMEGDEIISITAPYQGRRARKIPPLSATPIFTGDPK